MTARNKYLLKRFGIDEEQYEQLLRKQEFRCGTCGRHHLEFPRKLAVDHEHQKQGGGPIRGLLCNWCNHRLVGRWKKESLPLLKAVVAYLEKEYSEWIVPPRIKKKRKKNGRRRILRKKRNE